MGLAGAGAAATALLIGLSFTILVCALLLYGSLIAYAGARSKSAFGLLIGQCSLMVGLFLTWDSKAEKTGMVDHPIPNLTQWRIGFDMELIGLLLTAICFVIYVKQHNKELKKKNTNVVSNKQMFKNIIISQLTFISLSRTHTKRAPVLKALRLRGFI